MTPNEAGKMILEAFPLGISPELRYQLLDRMRSDCEYYIAHEQHCSPEYNHLWADHSPEKQIACMRWLYESIANDYKPEWISLEDIDNFAKRMEA